MTLSAVGTDIRGIKKTDLTVLLKPFELDQIEAFVRELSGCTDGDGVP